MAARIPATAGLSEPAPSGHECARRQLEASGEPGDLANVELALARENRRYHALRADLGKLRLDQLMLFHELAQQVRHGHLFQRQVRLFVLRDEVPEITRQRSERMLLISATGV